MATCRTLRDSYMSGGATIELTFKDVDAVARSMADRAARAAPSKRFYLPLRLIAGDLGATEEEKV